MSRAVISREGKAPIIINAPTDPEMAKLWNLAQAKITARGKAPETRDEWRAVTDEYHALQRKDRGSLGQMVRETCAKSGPGG